MATMVLISESPIGTMKDKIIATIMIRQKVRDMGMIDTKNTQVNRKSSRKIVAGVAIVIAVLTVLIIVILFSKTIRKLAPFDYTLVSFPGYDSQGVVVVALDETALLRDFF